MSLYAEQRAYLEAGTEAVLRKQEAWSIPADYAGTSFRSRLEAGWARTLDRYGIGWEYEPETVQLGDGRSYLPDFRLPGLATVIEVKGPHMLRLDKTREYARQACPDVIVLVGYPPQHRRLVEWHGESMLQWGDPLGYTATFTSCPECGTYQWCRLRSSLGCRACGKRLNGSHAACGEMPFYDWQDDGESFESILAKGGASLMTWFRLDDSFHSHPKVIAAGNEAVGLFVRCGTYAAEHTTDGFIAEEIAELYGASATGSRRNPATGKPETLAETLVRTGLWHRARRGWTIHDYLDYNPSREAVEKERKAAAERQRRRRGGIPSRRDSPRDTAVSHTTPTRRVGRTESHPPGPPAGPAGRANPAGPPDRPGKPSWCGECDERTRLVGDADSPRRCPACHPLAEQVT